MGTSEAIAVKSHLMLLLAVSGGLLTAETAQAADGLVVCSPRPIEKGAPFAASALPHQAEAIKKDLEAGGYRAVVSAASGPDHAVIMMMTIKPTAAFAFYDTNVQAISPGISIGDFAQLRQFVSPGMSCELIAKRKLCAGNVPCG